MTEIMLQLSLTKEEFEQLVYLLDPGKEDWERDVDQQELLMKLRASWDHATQHLNPDYNPYPPVNTDD